MKINTKKLVMLAVLTAAEIVLSKVVSIPVGNITRFSLAGVALAVSAILYGPIYAGIVGGLADFLGSLIFPIGAYFPGFTLSAVVAGVLFGLILYKKELTIPRIIFAVLASTIARTLIINSLWLVLLYGGAYFVVLGGRVVQAIFCSAAQIILIITISKIRFFKSQVD